MSEVTVIYDPALELGAIIDTDTMRACGPVGGGPQAKQELEQFVNAVPAAIFETTDTYTLTRAWMDYWTANFQGLHADESGNASPVVEPATTGNDGAALAEHTASATSGEPPPPAAADTDMEANAGEAPSVAGGANGTTDTAPPAAPAEQSYTGRCFACGGTGQVTNSDGTTATCNLCNGSGTITAQPPQAQTATTTEGTQS